MAPIYLDVHTHRLYSGDNVVSIQNVRVSKDLSVDNAVYSQRYYSIGLHPWDIDSQWQKYMAVVRRKAFSDDFLAVGETGIDKLCDAPISLQETIFREHIDISENCGKPLIIHCVKSFEKILSIRSEIKPKQSWIVHGFRGKPQQAEQLVKHGLYLSFGEHHNAESALIAYNNKHLLIETDESSLGIDEIYSLVSKEINIDIEELKEYTTGFFRQIFITKLL